MKTSSPAGKRPAPRRVLYGSQEPIFKVLPETVRANLLHPRSENALVWNALYPRLWPARPLGNLMALRPLWGTPEAEFSNDLMRPFFWGYSVDGQRLAGLDASLEAVDGPGPKTEVDLFLLGHRELVLVEAKRSSGLGRCRRFAARRCPLAQPVENGDLEPCRYWGVSEARFDQDVRLRQPEAGDPHPECNRHYQLARTLRVGRHLAEYLGCQLHIWLLAPERTWGRSLRSDWLDFAERLIDPALWRRFRVLAWESLMQLPPLEGPLATHD